MKPTFTKILLLIAISIAVLGIGSGRALAQNPGAPVQIFISESVGVAEGSGNNVPTSTGVIENVGVADSVTTLLPATISIIETVGVRDFGGPVDSAPQVDAGLDFTIDEGTVATLAASVIVLDPQLTTATIEWGDGTNDQVIPSAAGEIAVSN